MLKYPINLIVSDNKKNIDFLHNPSKEVKIPLNKVDLKIVKLLKKYLKDSQNPKIKEKYSLKEGMGLSAVQIGFLKNIFYILIRIHDHERNEKYIYERCFANPKIIEHNPMIFYLDGGEGCLSVDQPREKVLRSSWIKLQAYDILKKEFIEEEFNDLLAIIIQHEIDHGKGILYTDKIANIDIEKHHPIFLEIKEELI